MSTESTLSEQLIARWIDPHGRKPGPAEAWVLPAHVPAWALITQLELDRWDVAGVADDYDLPTEAVEAAIAYYHRHQAAIDERIARNRALLGS